MLLNLLFSRLNFPSSFRLSFYESCFSSLIVFVILHWTFFSMSTTLFCWRAQNWSHSSVLSRGNDSSSSICWKCFSCCCQGCCSPSLPSWYIPVSWSTCHSPGPLHSLLQSCFADSDPPAFPGLWIYSSAGTWLGISLFSLGSSCPISSSYWGFSEW